MKASPVTRGRAKAMRRALTEPETILWAQLKGRKLGGRQFRRQHPIGPYIADFACPKLKLVVELDGETHSTDAELAHDAARTEYLEGEGWRVVRFWNHEIRDNLRGVIEAVSVAAFELEHARAGGRGGEVIG